MLPDLLLMTFIDEDEGNVGIEEDCEISFLITLLPILLPLLLRLGKDVFDTEVILLRSLVKVLLSLLAVEDWLLVKLDENIFA